MSDLTSLATDFGVTPIDRAKWREIARHIIIEQAHIYDVKPIDIVGYSRKQTISHARQSVMWHINKTLTGITSGEIGKLLGRDRTTVMHGIQAHIERMGGDK